MNESIPPVEEEVVVEEEVEELKFGDKVIYTDPEGNEITCKISRTEGDLHLVEGLVEVTFDNGSQKAVPADKVRRIEKSEKSEILE